MCYYVKLFDRTMYYISNVVFNGLNSNLNIVRLCIWYACVVWFTEVFRSQHYLSFTISPMGSIISLVVCTHAKKERWDLIYLCSLLE